MYYGRQSEEHVVKTVRLKSSDLEAVVRLLDQLLEGGAAEQSESSATGVSADPYSPAHLLKFAKHMLQARRLRSECFKKPMFGEPAWDMLLTLYVNAADGARQSIGRLCAASDAPSTTALRWLDYLEKERLVVREHNPTDRRSDFVELTPKGQSAMEQYLSETLRTLI